MSGLARTKWNAGRTTLSTWTDELVKRWLGSWIVLSEDRGGTWSAPIRVPASTPHGPIVLANGDLLYLGKDATEMSEGRIVAARSHDGWAHLASARNSAALSGHCRHQLSRAARGGTAGWAAGGHDPALRVRARMRWRRPDWWSSA